MHAIRTFRHSAKLQTDFRLREVPVAEEPASFWWINGYRTKLLIWTRDEWEKLKNPPSDAQFHPAGFWCALRTD